MSELNFHNTWVSLAVILPIGAVGLFILRNDPEAKGWLVLLLVVCGVILRHLLDGRELRRHEHD